MKYLVVSIVLVLFLFIPQCRSINQSESNIPLNDTLAIGYHKAVYIQRDNNTEISFDSIIEDSRCPKNMECITMGGAMVQITFAKQDEAIRCNLNLGYNSSEKIDTVFDYRIQLVDLLPYPDLPDHPSYTLDTAGNCILNKKTVSTEPSIKIVVSKIKNN